MFLSLTDTTLLYIPSVDAIIHIYMNTLDDDVKVDGEYEDWMEVLKLIYHGGGSI